MKQIRSFIAVIAGILALCFTVISYSQESAEGIYKMRCSGCHGADGKTTGMGKMMGAKSFSAPEVISLPDSALLEIIKKGKGKMPAFEDKLTVGQINSLVKYLRGLK